MNTPMPIYVPASMPDGTIIWQWVGDCHLANDIVTDPGVTLYTCYRCQRIYKGYCPEHLTRKWDGPVMEVKL